MSFSISGPRGPPSLRKAGAKIRTHAERANKTRDFFQRKSGRTGKHAVTQDNTRGKSFEKKEEGRETDTFIILYIRTEDEGNGNIYARKTKGTGAEGQKKVPCSHSKDKVIHLKLSINKSLTYKNQLFQPLTCRFYSFLISCH